MSKIETVYGIHPVRVLLETASHNVISLYIQKDGKNQRLKALTKMAEKYKIVIKYISHKELNTLAGEKHQGVIAKCKTFNSFGEHVLQTIIKNCNIPVLLLILDGVTDPHNLGACFRSAEALGVRAMIVPKDRAVEITPIVRKVACGTVEMLPFIQVTNLSRTIRWLQNQGIWIVGTVADADFQIQDVDLTGNIAIILGGEGKGIRHLTKKYCDFLAKIPLQGNTKSLNISVACGICLYEVERQRMLIN